MAKKMLVIGMIWPEPGTTAAGIRMLQLLEVFKKKNYDITFVSTAVKGAHSFDLSSLQITTRQVHLNDVRFDTFVKALNPDIVMFDRFITEEQFGWRVAENCPKALRILDAEDLHSLREARKTAFNSKQDNWHNEFRTSVLTKREIASIYRCDLTLLISSFEYKVLIDEFNIPNNQLHVIPFLINNEIREEIAAYPQFNERRNFMSIGNFNHAPNLEAVRYLKREIWPELHTELPDTELHIFGAYLPQSIKKLHDPKTKFLIKGWIPDSKDAFVNYRVCLAPLQFGAGQKGKLFESMKYGTPNITSKIGAESMGSKENWNGFISDDKTLFIKNAVNLYTNRDIWYSKQKNGMDLLCNNFYSKKFIDPFLETIDHLQSNLENHRSVNFIGGMLIQHTTHSTKYFSKWIELKNKIKALDNQ